MWSNVKQHGDFYYPICFHSFRTEKKLEVHNKVCKNQGFCNILIHFEDTKIFGFNQYQKSDKTPVVVYVDLVYLIETIYRCKNASENQSTTKVAQHIP